MAGLGILRGRLRCHERGAAAVEFALVLPVLMMLMFGIFTAGLSYTHSIGLSNAVREGARFGATTDTSSGTWADDVISRVRATQFDDSTDITQTTTEVCVRLLTTPSTASTVANTAKCSTGPNTPSLAVSPAPPITGIPNGTCVVQVWAARPYQIWILVAPAWNGTSVQTSVARYERTGC